MHKEQVSSSPSTTQQLFKVLRHEHPLFALSLLKNTTVYGTQKYLLRNPFMIKKIHGYRMKFDLQDPGISRSLLLVGDREREHRYILEKIIQPDQTILDLGANIGYYVLMEHQLMQNTGHVIAVEPSPSNFKALKENIELNDKTGNTTLIEAAVADHEGEASLHLSKLSNVHSLVEEQVASAINQHITVKAISLENIIEKYGNVDLIRMDVEGYEINILNSLIKLQESKPIKPHILFELHPAKYKNQQFDQLLEELFNIGYQAEYLACPHVDKLKSENLNIVASIPTDGRVRHIAKNISLTSLKKLYPYSRALLISPKDSA